MRACLLLLRYESSRRRSSFRRDMFQMTGSVRKLLEADSVTIDNVVFRLHHKVTVAVLLLFSLVIASRQHVGDPIDCIAEGVPARSMNTYCWIHSTFTLPDRPGGLGAPKKGETVKYQKYYHWVFFVLFLQAILFYIPRLAWKTWEGGKMKMIVLGLDCPVLSKDVRNERKKVLAEYVVSHLHRHDVYAFRFFFCELLNVVNVVGQIYFLDYFLDGEFSTYGRDVFKMTDAEDRFDPMSKIFPKMTKCTFEKYGPSGTIQRIDGLCILPLNAVNEKIYVFLWVWFVILALASSLFLLFRACTVFSKRVRTRLLRAQARLAPRRAVEMVARKCRVGDWFLLVLLGANIDSLVFTELVCDLALEFEAQTASRIRADDV